MVDSIVPCHAEKTLVYPSVMKRRTSRRLGYDVNLNGIFGILPHGFKSMLKEGVSSGKSELSCGRPSGFRLRLCLFFLISFVNPIIQSVPIPRDFDGIKLHPRN